MPDFKPSDRDRLEGRWGKVIHNALRFQWPEVVDVVVESPYVYIFVRENPPDMPTNRGAWDDVRAWDAAEDEIGEEVCDDERDKVFRYWMPETLGPVKPGPIRLRAVPSNAPED